MCVCVYVVSLSSDQQHQYVSSGEGCDFVARPRGCIFLCRVLAWLLLQIVMMVIVVIWVIITTVMFLYVGISFYVMVVTSDLLIASFLSTCVRINNPDSRLLDCLKNRVERHFFLVGIVKKTVEQRQCYN